jgi:DNA repair protein SbcC/Rad50
VRPLRIELEGFGSFQQTAHVDLTETDLFVLSGATGSGKTTIVESAVFALYGSVPRYDDRRLVAPVINQSRNEARVRLTFAVSGRTYQATRVVRRTKQGATTKEARLEDVTDGGLRTIAGNADELTAAVGGLVGLTFEQFTRSVVLPQGAFDRFLFAKPADRADLLVQLLDLGVYEDVGKRARSLATASEARAGELQRQLDGELAAATPEARAAAARQLERLEQLGTRCAELQPQLEATIEEGHAARQRATEAAADLEALASLRRPPDVGELATRLTAAAADRTRAEAALAETSAALDAAEERLAQLPPADRLAELRRLTAELAELTGQHADRDARRTRASADAARAADALAAADETVTAARAALDAARREELAHTLAAGLQAGDPCPVCHVPVDRLPDHGEAAATAQAQEALAAAEQRATAARQQLGAAERSLAAEEQAVASLHARRQAAETAHDELLRVLDLTADDGAGTGRLAEQLDAATEALDAASEALAAARAGEREARRVARETATASDQLRARADAAWATFDAARDRVARLGPPRADRTDLAASWDTLLGWADERRPAATAAAQEAADAVEHARSRWRELDGALRDECQGAGVEVATGSTPAIAVAGATEGARQRLRRLDDQLGRAEEARRALAAVREERTLAKALGDHLRADGFERWLLTRALGLLVRGASSILRELSSGAYSLALDDSNQFLVLDHRNADEPRTVRSLSGGERFLASLALALALAEHVAELAAEGAARLESLFLDEGFGTLDADTLDVVASAIEELGSRGRMVGVVTHVRDLAERLPVRFDVRRGPSGSTVRRVDVDAADTAERGDGVADVDDVTGVGGDGAGVGGGVAGVGGGVAGVGGGGVAGVGGGVAGVGGGGVAGVGGGGGPTGADGADGADGVDGVQGADEPAEAPASGADEPGDTEPEEAA